MATLVVIGFPDAAGDVIADVEQAAAKFANVVLVSTKYAHIKTIDLPDNATIVPDNANDVFTFRQRQSPPGGFPSYQARNATTPFSSRVEFIRTTSDVVRFACVERRLATDIFSLAALVKTEKFEGREWVVNVSRIEDALEDASVVPDFIIPTHSDAVAKYMRIAPAADLAAMKTLIVEGICCLRSWLRVGYHVLKNSGSIPGFAAQTNGRFISLVIAAHEIMPGEPDRSHEQAFFESASFRKVLCDASIHALSWFFTQSFPAGKYVSEDLLIQSLAVEKDRPEPGPLDFRTFDDSAMYPDHPMNEDMVAWNSYVTWDAIMATYA